MRGRYPSRRDERGDRRHPRCKASPLQDCRDGGHQARHQRLVSGRQRDERRYGQNEVHAGRDDGADEYRSTQSSPRIANLIADVRGNFESEQRVARQTECREHMPIDLLRPQADWLHGGAAVLNEPSRQRDQQSSREQRADGGQIDQPFLGDHAPDAETDQQRQEAKRRHLHRRAVSGYHRMLVHECKCAQPNRRHDQRGHIDGVRHRITPSRQEAVHSTQKPGGPHIHSSFPGKVLRQLDDGDALRNQPHDEGQRPREQYQRAVCDQRRQGIQIQHARDDHEHHVPQA